MPKKDTWDIKVTQENFRTGRNEAFPPEGEAPWKHTDKCYRVFFLTGPAPKSSKCWEWQNPYQKSESGPIQQ